MGFIVTKIVGLNTSVLAAHVWLLERNSTDFPTSGTVSTLEFETGRVLFSPGVCGCETSLSNELRSEKY